MSEPGALAITGFVLLLCGLLLSQVGQMGDDLLARLLGLGLLLLAPLCFIGAAWWAALS